MNSGEVLSPSDDPGHEIGEIIEQMEADVSKVKNEIVSDLSSTVEQQPESVYFSRPTV